MNIWNEILAENASDHEETLNNEDCRDCLEPLRDHYDCDGYWVTCSDLATNIHRALLSRIERGIA